jgi:hypothetical protein
VSKSAKQVITANVRQPINTQNMTRCSAWRVSVVVTLGRWIMRSCGGLVSLALAAERPGTSDLACVIAGKEAPSLTSLRASVQQAG